MTRRPSGPAPLTPAERARTARDRRRAAGKPAHRGKGKPKPPLFDVGEFVAIDGEGFTEGEPRTWRIGENETEYAGREHFYAYLAASDGTELYSQTDRLLTQECLDFLLSIKQRQRNAILVCFGAPYDFTQILAFGIEPDDLRLLLQGDGRRFSRKFLDISFGDYDYRLECRMRKSLTISRWNAGADKYEAYHKRSGEKAWRQTKCDKATLWDVWGFFQGSFLAALANWLPFDPDYDFIKSWKGKRSGFLRAELDEIRRYNAAELRCLVTMMNRVRGAIAGMGLKITRWDGAGAIAGAMMKHHTVREHMAETPEPVFIAARHAYSGGHIEICKLGHHNGTVHHYDVNSAYPHQFRLLPSLAFGEWHHSGGDGGDVDLAVPSGFTLVRVRYCFRTGMPFYPLFYREPNGTIVYPQRGEGWYWFPEFDVARDYFARHGGRTFTVLEWWHYSTTTNARPFQWIEDYFERRKFLVNEAKRTGVPSGEEKTLKLGYNSCYGKTAQQVGARYVDGEIQAPPYFQIEWAGYVTAGCRAQIMGAALARPNAIISFATDGLFATEPLPIPVSADKQLGAWEAQEHDGMTIVMPGVYWLHDGGKTKHYSRGFKKPDGDGGADIEDANTIRQAWATGQSHLPVPVTRLVTLGTALTSDSFWEMRGMFVVSERVLALNGDNSKRYPLTRLRQRGLHNQLCNTIPREPWDGEGDEAISAAYPIEWLQPDEDSGDGADRQLDGDVLAAFLA